MPYVYRCLICYAYLWRDEWTCKCGAHVDHWGCFNCVEFLINHCKPTPEKLAYCPYLNPKEQEKKEATNAHQS